MTFSIFESVRDIFRLMFSDQVLVPSVIITFVLVLAYCIFCFVRWLFHRKKITKYVIFDNCKM